MIMEKNCDKEQMHLITTGYTDLDKRLEGGYQIGQVITLWDRPQNGAQEFMRWSSFNISKTKGKVLYITNHLNTWPKANELNESTSLQIVSKTFLDSVVLDDLVEQIKPNIVMIDTNISTDVPNSLNKIAKEYQCVIILRAFISRTLDTKKDNRPTLADLEDNKGNKYLLSQSDIIIAFYNEEQYALKPCKDKYKNEGEFIIAHKNWEEKIKQIHNKYDLHAWTSNVGNFTLTWDRNGE